jgi:protein-tyrosine sulfotransferase
MVPSEWPIIIGGSHRSGTTLLRRLLDGHPHIFCPPEIKFHKDLLGQFPNDPLAHGRLGSSLRALGLPTEIWLDEFGRALCRCYDIAAQRAGKRRWADKNPENALNAPHWDRLLCGRMAFVLVVRHPLDVIASMAEIGMNKVIPADLVQRASHARDYILAGLAFAEAHTERSTIVRYEWLVRDPVTALSDLTCFLSEKYDGGMVDNLHKDCHGTGLEDPKILQHVGISGGSVGRWRRDLSRGEVDLVTPVVRPILERLGYE